VIVAVDMVMMVVEETARVAVALGMVVVAIMVRVKVKRLEMDPQVMVKKGLV
jgi:hypothetical protein